MKIINFLNKNRWSVPIGILMCSFILYGNSIINNYSLDDSLVVGANQNVNSGIKGIPAIIKSKTFKDEKSSYAYRPIPLITFAIEYQLFKANPHISHFISIFLYSLICVLLFINLKRLFPSSSFLIFLTTVLFLFQPLHSEVVNNIKCRDELLMMLFSLSGFYFFSKFYFSGKWKYFIIAAILMLTAFFCKHSAIVFSLIIPLALIFRDTKPDLKKIAPIFLTIVILFGLFICFRKLFTISDPHERILEYFENPLYRENGFPGRIPMAFFSLLYYLKLLFFPVQLSFYYGFNQIPVPQWTNFMTYAGIITALILLVLFIYFFIKKNKPITIGILLFGAGIGPFLNLIPAPGIIAERFAFIASIGWSLAFAGALITIFRLNPGSLPKYQLNKIFYLIFSLMLFLYSLRIIFRNPDWNTQLSLFEHDIKHLDNSAKAHALLAGELIAAASAEKDVRTRTIFLKRAINHYEKCLLIYPGYVSSWNNLGTIFFSSFQQYEKAISCFEKALQSDSGFSKAYFNLAFTYEKRGDIDKALKYYTKTTQTDSNFIDAYRNQGKLYFKKNMFKDAILVANEAIANNPHIPVLFVDAANYYAAKGDTLISIQYFETAFNSERELKKRKQLAGHLNKLFLTIGNKNKAAYYYAY